jgi:hypothetical protein
MSAQPFSRADRNRIRRGQRPDPPRTHAIRAKSAWAWNVVRREHPGQRYLPYGAFLKLIYDERDIAKAATRVHPLFRYIQQRAA